MSRNNKGLHWKSMIHGADLSKTTELGFWVDLLWFNSKSPTNARAWKSWVPVQLHWSEVGRQSIHAGSKSSLDESIDRVMMNGITQS